MINWLLSLVEKTAWIQIFVNECDIYFETTEVVIKLDLTFFPRLKPWAKKVRKYQGLDSMHKHIADFGFVTKAGSEKAKFLQGFGKM